MKFNWISILFLLIVGITADAQVYYFGVFISPGHVTDEVVTDFPNKGTAFGILNFEVGIENTSDKNDVSVTTGKSRSRGIEFTKLIGFNSSPILSTQLVAGTHLNEFHIVGYKQNESGLVKFIDYTFKVCVISSIDHPYSENDVLGTENVRMEVGAMKIEYWPGLPNGTISPTSVTTQWSFVKNNPTLEI